MGIVAAIIALLSGVVTLITLHYKEQLAQAAAASTPAAEVKTDESKTQADIAAGNAAATTLDFNALRPAASAGDNGVGSGNQGQPG